MSCCDHDLYVVEERMDGFPSEFIGLAYSCSNGAIGLAESHASEINIDALINVYGMTKDEEPVLVHQVVVVKGKIMRGFKHYFKDVR